jgi:hypothetical protein
VEDQNIESSYPADETLGISYGSAWDSGVELGSSANEYYEDPEYCESKFVCVRIARVAVGCYDADGWDNEAFPTRIAFFPFRLIAKPSNWPSKGLVVSVVTEWFSTSLFNDCGGDPGVCGAFRLLLYSLKCDGEGLPSTGELFYDSGPSADDCDPDPGPCFDCGDLNLLPAWNEDCAGTPEPTAVGSVENPLP